MCCQEVGALEVVAEHVTWVYYFSLPGSSLLLLFLGHHTLSSFHPPDPSTMIFLPWNQLTMSTKSGPKNPPSLKGGCWVLCHSDKKVTKTLLVAPTRGDHLFWAQAGPSG